MSRQPSPGPSHPPSHPPFHPTQPSARQRPKPYATGIAAGAEDAKYKTKYRELKKKVKEIEAVSPLTTTPPAVTYVLTPHQGQRQIAVQNASGEAQYITHED